MLINKLYLTIFLLGWFSCVQAENITLTVTKAGDGNGTITSNPAGINCGNNCIFSYAENTQVTLTATPELSGFNGWTGDCSGTEATITVTVDTAKTCSANFGLFSSIQFANSNYTVDEDAGQINLSITRAGGSGGEVSVTYATKDGTAIAGDDYAAVNNTLTWQTGEMNAKTIQIPVFTDGILEDNENLTVELSNISTGSVLGNTISATITLTDPPPNPAGILQFSSPSYVASEGNGVATLNVERLASGLGLIAIKYQTIDNVAKAGSDYIGTQGMLTWNDGDMTAKTFTIPITTDAITETAEHLAVRLFNSIGGASLGVNSTTDLHVIDDLGSPLTVEDLLGTPNTILIPGVIQFSAPADYKAAKDVGNITLNVNRVYSKQGQVQVDYSTQDGTARVDTDYTAINGTLQWNDGDMSSKKITIPILATSQPEKTLIVNLSNPTGKASLGAFPTANIQIVDSLSNPGTVIPPGGIIQFSAQEYQLSEDDGSVTITVTRTGNSKEAVEVFYTTENDTADNQDYVAIKNSLSWVANETESKTFQINIYDDGLIEDNETVSLRLFNLTGKAELGPNSTANLTIFDNDATTIKLSANNYQVNENDKAVTITATREGGKVDQIMLAYETENITATAGLDYTATSASSGILMWVSGDSGEKTFTIPIYDDKIVEDDETLRVRLTLMGNQDNSILGSPIEAIITIIDDDTDICNLENTTIINCTIDNSDNLLQNVKVVSQGAIIGGQLAGKIELASENNINLATLKDVTLLANSNVVGMFFGGKIQGNITGDQDAPAIIDNVAIEANTILSHVIIGSLTTLADDLVLQNNTWLSSIQLEKGVLFETNSLIPYMADLSKVLGRIYTPDLELDAIDLNHDILFNGERVIDSINGLHVFTSLGVKLWQSPDNGYLTVNIDNRYYKVLPIQAKHIWGEIENVQLTPMGTTVNPSGQVTFVTHTGREIITIPVVHEVNALQKGLLELGLSYMTMLVNGNLKIPVGKNYYMARPNLFATDAPINIPLGIGATNSPWLENLNEAFLVYETIENVGKPITLFESDNTIQTTVVRQQQFIYPAAAEPEVLYALAAERENPADDCQTKLYNDGRVSMCIGIGQNKLIYKGVLDYLVESGIKNAETLQIIDVEDFNNDGLQDYRLIYPNGDRQIMYRCSGCVE
ncbi:Calx-beta domain-containing protein [Candidatus Halobeggiatoa sp. HSG11]|nr:Calx-beta domain-containing protein [Candidatus Halobeggiatoa sp. HSG11]